MGEDDSFKETRPLLPNRQHSSYDRFWCSTRFSVMCTLTFLGVFNLYSLRVNLSVAIVSMLNTTTDASNASTACPDHDANHNRSHSNSPYKHQGGSAPMYNWDEGQVLAAFYYGYISTQLIGGSLAEQIGGKLLLGFGVLCTAVLTLATPLVSSWGEGPFIALRALEGMGEGVTLPALHAIWSKWAPPLERSWLVVICYTGSSAGTVIAMPVSGLLCKYGFAGGWPSAFYVFGGIGVVWCIFWFLLAADSPSKSRLISDEERAYIEGKIGHSATAPRVGILEMPWRSIVSSRAVWAICVGHVSHSFGFYILLSCLPTYMKNVLNFDVSESGILSALPYTAMFVVNVITGAMVDVVRKRNIVTTGTARKCAQTIGLASPAACLVLVSYVGCDYVTAVILLCVGVGLSGGTSAGFLINHLDIAPKYAGTLMGITNTFGNIPGIVAPLVVSALTQHEETIPQWRKVFFIAMGAYLFGLVFYIIFASGEEQEWAKSADPAANTKKYMQCSDGEQAEQREENSVSESDDNALTC